MVELTIAICALLLLAYLFDITFAKTRIPTVILLLVLGGVVRYFTDYFEIPMPDLDPLLPLIGTIGLILIVLEGALELDLERSKALFITKSFFMAFLPLIVLVFGGAWILYTFFNIPYLKGMINLTPLAIISSAISIPSSQNLCTRNREFITYEGSFSDTLGVVFFNLITIENISERNVFGRFTLTIIIVLILSLIATLLLSYMLGKIKHKVKYIPIILIALLLYSVSEHYHMPGLIFIMLFGLFLGNVRKLSHFKFISRIQPETLEIEVVKFKELTSEATFLVRSLFFLLFGYLLDAAVLINSESLIWAVGITVGIYLVRYFFLKLLKIEILPLLFIAPRGLITIVLFLSISQSQHIPYIVQPVVIQVIILTSIIMMIELVTTQKRQ